MTSFKELTRKVLLDELDDESSTIYIKEKYARKERTYTIATTNVHVASKPATEEDQYWDWLFSVTEEDVQEDVCVLDS